MVKPLLIIIFAIGLIGFPSISCNSNQTNNQEMKKFGPNNPVSLVFFFRKETTHQQVETFLNEVIGKADPNGKGHDLADGVTLQFMVRNGDYLGYAITFSTEATDEQKNTLKDILKRSPLVYKTFENVIPNQITDL